MRKALLCAGCWAVVLVSSFVLSMPALATNINRHIDRDAEPSSHDQKQPVTYCNPMNLDYAFAPLLHHKPICHRSTADPVCAFYNGKYYLFSTNQEGYWWSTDLSDWHFISCLFKMNKSGDQVCAPALWATGKGLLFLPCFTPDDTMPLYFSAHPETGKWHEIVKSFPINCWDPSLFEDDDGKLYLYWDSSNVYPIYGVELDKRHGYTPLGKPAELLRLFPDKHGWEQFGEDNQHGKMAPFIEGAWMNKFAGRYYLQYGAPGTEWNVYGDGVYVSEHPLGPFVYQEHNPFSWKPTGFICGAGHGSTFADAYGNLWHVASMVISVKDTFERRLGLFPTALDKDGILYTDTAFGDYPHFIPRAKEDPVRDFTGWILLSYHKKCWADSTDSDPNLAFDENIKTYWTAPDAQPGRFLAVDLGCPCEVRAVQVNFADEKATLYGKQSGKRHRYQIYASLDNKKDNKEWKLLVDKSQNMTDVPHDYVQLSEAVKTQYLKIVNQEMPTGCFAVSDFRVFGNGPGDLPSSVKNFTVERDGADKRNVKLSWAKVLGAFAYNIRFGVKPDKLYSSMLIYDSSSYELHSLNVDSKYHFNIQAVAESGLSPLSATISVD